jgi:hypothetical protein
MKTNITLILLFAAILAGCSTTAHLYPVEGPLSKETPLPVLSAKIDGVSGYSGNITLTMPDGEKLTGRWSADPHLHRGEAIITGSKGTVVKAEFYVGGGSGTGTATDNHGNVFRILY